MKASPLVAGWLLTLLLAGSMKSAAAADPAQTPARTPQLWAIIIGIGKYSDPSIADNPPAADHAEVVLQWFRAAGWEDDHQLLLKDFGNRDPGTREAPAATILPTRNNLNWAIDEWLLKKAKAGDLVIIYFAGQSSTVTTTRPPLAEPKVDHYLLPIDAQKNNPAGTGWSLDGAVDQCALRRIRVVCWLGTNAGATGAVAQGAVARVAPPGHEWLRRLTRWPGVTAWLASSRPQGLGQASDPSGPFTSALAIATRCRSPPDIWVGKAFARWATPTA